jgi:hypothetical protein
MTKLSIWAKEESWLPRAEEGGGKGVAVKGGAGILVVPVLISCL